eukprot:scaffold64_cov248-Pinguiococcus_pyrenoidosus.AAC.6
MYTLTDLGTPIFTTWLTPGKSRPRLATSVVTTTPRRPSRRLLSTSTRSSLLSRPLKGAARMLFRSR